MWLGHSVIIMQIRKNFISSVTQYDSIFLTKTIQLAQPQRVNRFKKSARLIIGINEAS